VTAPAIPPFPFRLEFPPELPISARAEEITAPSSPPVVILAGETGSGKTTQIPKMCLAAGRGTPGRIACTQPRRVAALSISRRVAEELGVAWGREVGCKIRFNDQTTPQTVIKFLTDGMLLAEVQGDPLLRDYDTIIIDEAHERSLNIDFLLGHLRTLRYRRPGAEDHHHLRHDRHGGVQRGVRRRARHPGRGPDVSRRGHLCAARRAGPRLRRGR
jgi:ATP-dependent helicase HrpA